MPQHEHRYEFSPEEAEAYLRDQEQNRTEVFGEERLKETVGHEASPEAAQAFLNMLVTLCHDAGSQTHHSAHSRRVQREGTEKPLVLVTGTRQGIGFGGFGNMDGAQASVDFLVYKTKSGFQRNPMLRKHGIPNYRSYIREGMFVDERGAAMVQREVSGRDDRGRIATKPATADELEEATRILVSAVSYDDSLRASSRYPE